MVLVHMDPLDMEVTHIAVLEVQHLTMGFIQVHLLPKLLHMMEQVISPLHLIKVNSRDISIIKSSSWHAVLLHILGLCSFLFFFSHLF
jgi:hypothetical protein